MALGFCDFCEREPTEIHVFKVQTHRGEEVKHLCELCYQTSHAAHEHLYPQTSQVVRDMVAVTWKLYDMLTAVKK